MAERRPAGFLVPLGFYDGPEVESIPRRIRPAAIGVWTLCGTHSANKLQDGYVGPRMLKQLGCTDAIRAALKSTLGPDGEPDPLWMDARDGGVQFTKWAKYQRSRAEVKAYRESESERKRNEREAKRKRSTSDNTETSGRTSAGHPPDQRDPKTKTKTKTEEIRAHLPAQSHQSAALPTKNGAELARIRFANIPVQSPAAHQIARAFSDSLPVPIESGLQIEIATQIDKCLRDAIPPPAIAEGIREWSASQSWHPSQIPKFVMKAAAKVAAAQRPSGIGKPTLKAMGYEALAEELIAEMTRDQP